MVFLHHSGNPAQQLHKLAARVEIEETAYQDKECNSPNPYPICSRKTHEKDLPFITAEEVRKRNGDGDERIFIVVDTIVLDVTDFIRVHPGGEQILHGFGGQDCSWQWWNFHNRKIWHDVALTLRVGRTEGVENRHVKPCSSAKPLSHHETW